MGEEAEGGSHGRLHKWGLAVGEPVGRQSLAVTEPIQGELRSEGKLQWS